MLTADPAAQLRVVAHRLRFLRGNKNLTRGINPMKERIIHQKHLMAPALALLYLANWLALPAYPRESARRAVGRKALDPADVQVRLYYPRLVSRDGDGTEPDSSEYTGLAITNHSAEKATLTFTAYDTTGAPISGEGIDNPITIELEAGQQMPVVDSQLFGSGMPIQQSFGWIKVESNIREIVGLFMSFNRDLSMLEGGAASSATLTSFVLPEIKSEGFTQINIANPNDAPANLTFYLLDRNGWDRSTQVARAVNPNGVLAESIADLFPDVIPADSDYIWLTSDQGVVPFEYLGKIAQDVEGLNGLDANAGGTTLYAPQYVVGGPDWKSALSVINLDPEPGVVTFRFISDDGAQYGLTRQIAVAAYGKVYISDPSFFFECVDELFGEFDCAPETLVQGYLEIVSSGVRLAGSVVFGSSGDRTFTSALPLESTLQTRMTFSQVASNATYFTGIALLNPNEEETSASIEVYSSSGSLIASKTEAIGGRMRKSQLLTQLFTELPGLDLSSGYIKVTSERGLASFAVFGTTNLSVLSAIPAQAIP